MYVPVLPLQAHACNVPCLPTTVPLIVCILSLADAIYPDVDELKTEAMILNAVIVRPDQIDPYD